MTRRDIRPGFGAVSGRVFMDRDRLLMQRLKFPAALELITGKIPRHTKECYRWRNRDRLAKLERKPRRIEWLDDLAVAYDKIGQPAKAIETMHKKEAIKPGLYETYANLGTFHIHAGNLAESVIHIKKAIAINPDAHFGREVYQLYLVEYLLDKQAKKWPPKDYPDYSHFQAWGFAAYLCGRMHPNKPQQNDRMDYRLSQNETAAAVKGVLGMMRFARHDSPLLLEALGDLLASADNQGSYMAPSRQLATRAYLKASYGESAEDSKKRLREIATRALQLQSTSATNSSQLPMEDLEAAFKAELADAAAWHAHVAANEKKWIAESADPEASFDAVYYADPVVKTPVPDEIFQENSPEGQLLQIAVTIGSGLLVLLVAFVVYSRMKNRRAMTRLDQRQPTDPKAMLARRILHA